MAMKVGGADEYNSEINVTPMVDVMLVLLVIFIITAPLFTHALKVDLPTAQSAPAPEKPETISLSIDRTGKMFWNDAPIAENELAPRLVAASQRQPQPELQLRADKDTRYQVLAEVMSLPCLRKATGMAPLLNVENGSAP